MKHKLLFWRFFASLLLLAVSTLSWAYDFEVNGIYYNKNSDGTSLTVTYKNTDYRSYSGAVVIPSSVEYNEQNYSVTSIGDWAFRDCSGLTSVTIGNGVTSIGMGAFSGCSGLTSITIPESVTSIGESAFSGCSGLMSVTIPESVTNIGSYAFLGCSGLTSISIDVNNSVYDSRNNCNAIIETATNTLVSGCKNTTIPVSVTSIGKSAFSECSGLTSVDIPNSVTSIASSAFSGCSSLTSITVASGNTKYDSRNDCNAIIETSSNTLVSGCKNTVIPNTVTSIGWDAFRGCSGLTSITIPNSVTSIGGYAFYGCSGLTSITIPNSVTSIGSYAFWLCSGLTSVTIGNSVTSIDWCAFYGCSGLTSITIPESVTSIGFFAFYGCSGLTSVTIGNGVTSIDWCAFSGCSGLTSITIPNSVTSIGDDAFSGCSGLMSVTIPESVTSIGFNAFYGCSGLMSINIPNSVTNIGSYAFYGCSGLTSITIPNSVTRIGDWAFRDCSGLTSVTINSNAILSNHYTLYYSIKDIFGPQVSEYIIGNGVTSIGQYAFYDCSGLTSVTIPESVTNIGSYAFSGCSGLTSVTINSNEFLSGTSRINRVSEIFGEQVKEYIIGNNVTSIGYEAFYGCSGLSSVTIGSGVMSIGSQAFYNCSGLTSINVASGNTKYDSRNNCNAIIETATNTLVVGCKETIIPNSVTSIGNYAFYWCSGLTSITIPNSVTRIGANAFSGCSGLTSISVNVNNSVYDSRNNCNAIIETASNTLITGCKNTIIPNGVTSIAPFAFENCSGLSSITIPESVTKIGEYAFRGCSGLPVEGGVRYADTYLVEAAYRGQNSYSIKDGTRFIGEDAFMGCSNLSSISIPESVTSVGRGAFAECPSLPVSGNLRYADTYLVEAVDKTQETYVMRNDTKFIGDQAFDLCTSLTSIVIPESVRFINAGAFSRCNVLSKVTCLVTSSDRKAVAPVKPEPGIAPDEIANLYPFNPAHPDDPTTANVDETTGVTIDNVYPEDECKAKWLAYYKKVYSNRQATSKTNTKWTNLSRNPYIMRNESQVVLKATYVAEWNQYQQSKEEYDVYSKYETIPTPQVSETGIFETGIPSQATLYVYEDVIDAYRVTSPWSEFGQILPIDPLAVEEVKSNKNLKANDNAPIYDLMGRRLQQKPASGYYIQGGKKFFVK